MSENKVENKFSTVSPAGSAVSSSIAARVAFPVNEGASLTPFTVIVTVAFVLTPELLSVAVYVKVTSSDWFSLRLSNAVPGSKE